MNESDIKVLEFFEEYRRIRFPAIVGMDIVVDPNPLSKENFRDCLLEDFEKYWDKESWGERNILRVLYEVKSRAFKDQRDPPSDDKLNVFCQGWQEKRENIVDPDHLTWVSLGYNMKKRFGSKNCKEMEYAYRILEKEYHNIHQV